MGVVRLRLARFGRRNLPFYRIYAADSRAPRDGRHIEILGYYNPLPGMDGMKRIGVKSERVKYWMSVGAQPSDAVARLLWKVGLLPPPPTPQLMSKAEAAKIVAQMKVAEKEKALHQASQPAKDTARSDGKATKKGSKSK